jgi:hypothetical protein
LFRTYSLFVQWLSKPKTRKILFYPTGGNSEMSGFEEVEIMREEIIMVRKS